MQPARRGGRRQLARQSFSSVSIYSRLRACLATHRDLSHKRLSHWQKRSDLFFQLIIARTVLGEIRVEQLEAS
jgi:hypothetical protein